MKWKNTQKEKEEVAETAESDLEAVKEELEEQAQEASVESLQEELGKKQIELEEMNQRFLRVNADFQNYRKRVEKEKTDLYAFANEKIIGDLLNILDNLERALESSRNEEADQETGIFKGVEMILQQLEDTLKKHGVEEIKAVGEEFDPNLHHAVMQDSSDQYDTNQVMEVFQKGYTLNGRVIRPSMVKVAN